MLASPSPQSLLPPSRHANMVWIFPACRCLCWRRPPRKAFYLRRGTPTWSGLSRLAGAYVGVDLLAKPFTSVETRQHGPDFLGLSAPMLVSPSSQSLLPPSRHANMVRIFPAAGRLCWRRPPRKAFYLRRGTPTWSGFSRPAGRPGRQKSKKSGPAISSGSGFRLYRNSYIPFRR